MFTNGGVPYSNVLKAKMQQMPIDFLCPVVSGDCSQAAVGMVAGAVPSVGNALPSYRPRHDPQQQPGPG